MCFQLRVDDYRVVAQTRKAGLLEVCAPFLTGTTGVPQSLNDVGVQMP